MKAPETGGNLHAYEISAEQHQRKHKFVDRQRKVPGLSLWEINLQELTIRRAVLKPTVVTRTTKSGLLVTNTNHVVQINEGCQYVQALNKKNAVRKWQKHHGVTIELREVKDVA